MRSPGILLAGTGYLFSAACCRRKRQTVAWMIIFFFASAAASSAYLTVERDASRSEIRALAIAFFYAIGTGIGGVAGPWLFGMLIDSGIARAAWLRAIFSARR